METEAPQSQLFLHDLIDEQDPLELVKIHSFLLFLFFKFYLV